MASKLHFPVVAPDTQFPVAAGDTLSDTKLAADLIRITWNELPCVSEAFAGCNVRSIKRSVRQTAVQRSSSYCVTLEQVAGGVNKSK